MTQMRVGAKYYSAGTAVEVEVVRPADVVLGCAGVPMVESRAGDVGDSVGEIVVYLGRRYVDQRSGLVVMCTRSGIGPLTADGRELIMDSA